MLQKYDDRPFIQMKKPSEVHCLGDDFLRSFVEKEVLIVLRAFTETYSCVLCKSNVHCATCKAWIEAGVSFFLQVLQEIPWLRGALAGRVRLIWINVSSYSAIHRTKEKNFRCLKVWKFLKIFFFKMCLFGKAQMPWGLIFTLWSLHHMGHTDQRFL